MSFGNNQWSNPNQNPVQPRYQPPTGYTGYNGAASGNNNGPTYAWPGPDGTNNATTDYGYSYNNGFNPTPVQPDVQIYDPQAELYRRATKRADAKLRFFKHLKNYIFVNVLLWGIAIISAVGSWHGRWMDGQEGHWSVWGIIWPVWVTMFWGIGLVSEYVNLFVINENRKQNMIEEEMRRLRR